MRKPLVAVIIFVALVAAVVGGAYWLSRPAEVSAAVPKAAPPVGSCWKVDSATAAKPFPWPGRPVGCADPHTVEVFQVGQVDRQLAAQARDAKGDDAKVERTVMTTQARSACTGLASAFLGGEWRAARVQVIASWITPVESGHFGCALAEVAEPAGTTFQSRTGSLKGAAGAVGIGCVANSAYTHCEQPHDGEYVGRYTLTPPGAPFDPAKVRDAAQKGCAELVTKYVGAQRADLRTGYVGPTTLRAWQGSDQTFACYALTTAADKLRGSVKGLGSGALPR
jgi:hypothetical protein